MCIFLYVFTLLYMQIFGGNLNRAYRSNWDNLLNSFMLTF